MSMSTSSPDIPLQTTLWDEVFASVMAEGPCADIVASAPVKARLLLGDGLAWMKECEPGSLDLILTDPPYESLDRHRAVGTTTRLGGHHEQNKRGGWFDSISNAQLFDFLRDCRRALRPDRMMWIVCDHETSGLAQAFVRNQMMGTKDDQGRRIPAKEQITYIKDYPVIKCAANGGVRMGTGYHGRATTERAILIKKGNCSLTDQNWPDFFTPVWNGDSDSKQYTPDSKKYDTAKPVLFLERLIELASLPQYLVCDPFMGSGSCAQAALQLGRHFVGVDKNPRALATAQKRVEVFEYTLATAPSDAGALRAMAAYRRARMHAIPSCQPAV